MADHAESALGPTNPAPGCTSKTHVLGPIGAANKPVCSRLSRNRKRTWERSAATSDTDPERKWKIWIPVKEYL